MTRSAANPMRWATLTLLVLQVVAYLLFLYRLGGSHLYETRFVVVVLYDAVAVVSCAALGGMVYLSDRRLVPAALLASQVVLRLWIAMSGWVPEPLSFLPAMALYMAVQPALVSVVAWERCARPWPVVAAITASWLVPHADVLLPTDTAAASILIATLEMVAATFAYGWFAGHARSGTERAGWPLVLLAAVPLVRAWASAAAWIGTPTDGSLRQMIVEVALLGLTALAFAALARRRVGAEGVVGLALTGALLWALGAFLSDWSVEGAGNLLAWVQLLSMACTVALCFASLRVLWRLARQLDDAGLARRTVGTAAWFAGFWLAAAAMVGALLAWWPQVALVPVLILAVPLGICGLVAQVQWVRSCLGLAARLEVDPRSRPARTRPSMEATARSLP